MNSLVTLLTIVGSSQAFTPMNNVQKTSTMISKASSVRSNTFLKMASVDDEVAALRAAAQKAREDAQKLAKVGSGNVFFLLSSRVNRA